MIYRVERREVRIYTLDHLPQDTVFFLDPEQRHNIGILQYHIGDLLRYRIVTNETTLRVELQGLVVQQGSIEIGHGYIIQDEYSGYCVIYKLRHAEAYTSVGKRVRMVLHGEVVGLRKSGDQLGQIYYPDTREVVLTDQKDVRIIR